MYICIHTGIHIYVCVYINEQWLFSFSFYMIGKYTPNCSRGGEPYVQSTREPHVTWVQWTLLHHLSSRVSFLHPSDSQVTPSQYLMY